MCEENMVNMKSLAEFNAERSLGYSNSPIKNGIACPRCGEELWDSMPMVTLTTDPPQKHIKCINCDYYGYRLA